MMEEINVAKLQHIQNDLRSDLVFEHICTPLLQEELINHEDYQRIKSKTTDPEKIDILIEILPTKAANSFDKFIKILEKDYPWLAQSLKEVKVEELENNKNEDKRRIAFTLGIQKVLQVSSVLLNYNEHQNFIVGLIWSGITKEMMSIVRRNHRVNKNWTGLAHTLGLSNRVHAIRSKVNIYCEDADVCILYLLEDWVGQAPKEATLGGLLYALREENHNDCADELEIRFA
ncbi:hypothetical protein C0J52_13037 [Blattella germanica]|nr:hypothetical protein C0J52_13037 [Blattella germanica]